MTAANALPIPPSHELAEVIAEWQLPLQLFRDLLDAFAQDVVKKRYADYAELLDYCRRSANPVGRLLLHLVDRASDENLHRSDCICSALQLINFWQDIAIDWEKERVYLPQNDLARFGIDEAQIAERALERRMGGATRLRDRPGTFDDARRSPSCAAASRPHGLGNPLDRPGRPAHPGKNPPCARRRFPPPPAAGPG